MALLLTVVIIVFLIGFGISCIFARDRVWKIESTLIRARGTKPERSEAWEKRTVILGIFAIIVAVCFLFLIIKIKHEQSASYKSLENINYDNIFPSFKEKEKRP